MSDHTETATSANEVPHHGGTPSEMLRDLADFLDTLDNLGEKLVISAPGHRLDGRSLDSILNPGEDHRTMQADVRWLADALESGSSDQRDRTDQS